MHSRIFQISTYPIEEDMLLTPASLYDDSHDFADYIGDKFTGNERLELIEGLAEDLSELFDYIGDGTLVYKGMGTFLGDWVNRIKDITNSITADNILKELNLYKLSKITDRTHKDLYSRFYMEEWNNYPGPLSDLIELLAKQNVGTKLYVGSVIDYHF